jgi:hypothetical protein
MNTLTTHNRYMTPKWRAYVTPGDKAFTFSNGIKVASMWELKQALLSLPEDIVMDHIREDANDIAIWVEHVVGDVDLADEMKKYNHRWGLIVALERQMMRTLELPDFVAKRWLQKAENGFTFVSGEKVSSVEELRDALEKVSDDTIAFHCERFPNDMAVWVIDIIGDYELAELLNEATSRQQMQRFVADHVEMLRDATE